MKVALISHEMYKMKNNVMQYAESARELEITLPVWYDKELRNSNNIYSSCK